MARLLFAAALLLVIALPRAAFAEAPKVVTSILPLQSLAANVMRGLGEPALLVRGAATPHSFALRPSDAAALQEAELVIWVGEGLETFLAAPLSTLSGEAKLLELSEAEGVTLLPSREEAIWAEHGQAEHDHDHGVGGEHDHGLYDPHIWLDPLNAVATVEAITAALAELDLENAAAYRANAEDTVARLHTLDEELEAKLTPVANWPYLVFHDGYQYFEAHYGLSPLGAVSLSPGRSPGAGHLAEIRERLQAEGVACVFSEPQFEPKLLQVVTEGTGAHGATLDPLGANLTPGPEAYFRLMQDMAASLTACLGGNG